MRRTLIVLAAVSLVGAVQPSTAQVAIDMNQVKCGDWLGYNPEQQDFIRLWLSGYYHAAGNSNVLDYDLLLKNSAKVTAHCRSHRSDTLPTAIRKAVE